MKIYRAGIVGCGRIAGGFDQDAGPGIVRTHAAAYQSDPRIELAACCDIDLKKTCGFARRWSIPSAYTRYHTMLQKEDLDILSICTHAGLHEPIVKAAVRAGVRAIFCEKPLADNLSAARRIVSLCKSKKVLLAVDHQRRWDPFHQRIRAALDRGIVGPLQRVNCFYGAGIANTGSHLFDLCRAFFGDVEWVQALPPEDGWKKAPDPDLTGRLRFKRGGEAMIQPIDLSKFSLFEMDILGERGRLQLIHNGRRAVLWKVSAQKNPSGRRLLSQDPIIWNARAGVWPLKQAVNEIVAALSQKREKVACTGHDGLKSLEIILSLLESAHRGGKRIALKEPS